MRLVLACLLAPLVTLGLLLFMATLVQQEGDALAKAPAPPYLDLRMTDREETLERKRRHKPKPPEPKPRPLPQPASRPKPQAAPPGSPVKLSLPSLDLATDVAALALPVPGVRAEPTPAPAPVAPTAPVRQAMAAPLLRVEPQYPPQALRRRKEGYVVLSFTINPAGRVEEIEVVEAQPPNWFERAAIRALRKWKYQPIVVDGQPVAQPGQTIKLEFVMGS